MATNKQTRRGSAYIIVLGSATAVMVIGLSALTLVRITRRSVQDAAGLAQARFHARTAVEMGLYQIASVPDWRNTFPSGTWLADQPIGTGTYTLDGVDPTDADLADSLYDPLVLTGTGTEGDAVYKLEVALTVESPPLTCLLVAAHANSNLNFNGGTTNCAQTMSANNKISNSAGTVNVNVEAVGTITGSGYTGTITTGIEPRTVPDPASVFDYYIANGTPMTVPGMNIDKKLISPANNPYGATVNPQGIYVIDCQGLTIQIQNSRIVGTLVLLDPASNSEIKPEIHWEPAVSNFPCLLVRGSLSVNCGNNGVSEPSGVSFNPPGTPYLGVEDLDNDDIYPSRLKGLLYVSNTLAVNNYAAFEGVVVAGAGIGINANVTATYDSTFYANPPSGFREPLRMAISEGSWRRIVD